MRKPKFGHPWTAAGQFINYAEQSRSRSFAQHLASLPASEQAAIRKAELAYLARLADERTQRGASERYFRESMAVVQEGDPVHVFVT